MKTIALIVGTCCILLFVAFSVNADPAGSREGSAEFHELKRQVSSLRERVEALEKKAIIVSRLQPRTHEFMIKLPEALRRHAYLPKGWQEREFNGIIYYVIPLGQDVRYPSRMVK